MITKNGKILVNVNGNAFHHLFVSQHDVGILSKQIKVLLEHKTDINLIGENFRNRAPLELFFKHNKNPSPEILKLMLDSKASPHPFVDIENLYGEVGYDIFGQSDIMEIYFKRCEFVSIDILALIFKSNFSYKHYMLNFYIFITAHKRGEELDSKVIEYLLGKCDLNLNVSRYRSCTTLELLISLAPHRIDLVELFIKNKCALNYPVEGNSAFCRHGGLMHTLLELDPRKKKVDILKLVDLLTKNGAPMNIWKTFGTPLSVAMDNKDLEKGTISGLILRGFVPYSIDDNPSDGKTSVVIKTEYLNDRDRDSLLLCMIKIGAHPVGEGCLGKIYQKYEEIGFWTPERHDLYKIMPNWKEMNDVIMIFIMHVKRLECLLLSRIPKPIRNIIIALIFKIETSDLKIKFRE